MPGQVPKQDETGEEQTGRTSPSSDRSSPIDNTEKMQMLRAMKDQLIANRTTISEKDIQLDEAKQLVALARQETEDMRVINEKLVSQNKQLQKRVIVTREMSQLGKQMAQLKDLEVKSLKVEIHGLMEKIRLLNNKVENKNCDDLVESEAHQNLQIQLKVIEEESKKQAAIIAKLEQDCLYPLTAGNPLSEKLFVMNGLFLELEKEDNEMSFLELVGERITSLLALEKEESLIENNFSLHACFKTIHEEEPSPVALNARNTLLFIKDLLINRRKLESEVQSLKEVNNQLKLTMLEQERELSSINIELTSAWGMINKVKNQHGILHNAREAHRHDLREKRKLLTKLKEELEFSHKKLLSLRVMNKESEAEFQSMRDERESRILEDNALKVDEAVKIVEEMVPDKPEELDGADTPIFIDSPSSEESRIASPTESEALPSNDEIVDTESVKILDKEERLKLLEDQCKFLYARVLRSTHRSILLAERLSALHDQYGSNEESATSKASTPAPETPKERTPPKSE